MRISHVIGSIDNNKGGPSRSVTQLLAVLGKSYPNLKFHLHTAESQNPILQQFELKNLHLFFYKTKSLGKLIDLEKSLCHGTTILYHGQTIWDLPMHQMAKMARKLNVPYIITPRGMLEPWSLQQRKFKKMLALRLYQFKDLQRAACLHATAPMEAESIRALGLKNPIAVIPNGVHLEDFKLKDFNKVKTSNKILFLSRIHPKKGIELLIEAWSHLPANLTMAWEIDIIGNGEHAYIEQLQSSIYQKGLSKSIKISPPVYGKEKMEVYQQANLFVLPTYSENFGIVIAEALACGTPVITTHGTPWQELETQKCGWWIPTGEDALRATLEQALALPQKELDLMGKNGRQLIENKYSMQAVAEQMYELYQWILKKKEQPDFVRVN